MIVRARDPGTAGTVTLDVELLIGGSPVGAAQSQSYADPDVEEEFDINIAAWNVDRTATEMDGLQVRLTPRQSGMPGTNACELELVNTEVAYTPFTAFEPTALSGTEPPDVNSSLGPFEIGSTKYIPALKPTDHDRLVMMATTTASPADGDWDPLDGEIVMANAIKSMWAVEDSSDIKIGTQEDDGRVAFHIFDPGTAVWTTENETVAVAGDTNFDNAPEHFAVTLAVRADGDRVIAAAYTDDVVAGGGAHRLRVFEKGTTGAWVNRGELGGTRHQDKVGVVAISPDSSDMITFVYNAFAAIDALLANINPMVGLHGVGGTNEEVSQGFIPDTDIRVDTLRIGVGKTASPTDDFTTGIRADSSGDPDTSYLASDSRTAASITTSQVLYDFDMGGLLLTAGTTYYVHATRGDTWDSANRFKVSDSDAADIYPHGFRKVMDTGTWTDDTDKDLLFKLTGQGNVQLATINSSNTISTAVEIDDQCDGATYLVGPGVIDSANKIYVPYIDSNDKISVASWTSGASPTPSVDATMGDNTVYGQGRTAAPFVAACLGVDGTDVHLLYANSSDQDMWYDDDVDGGGMTDTEELDATGVINRIYCAKGTSDLLVAYEEAGTLKFRAISLGGVHTGVSAQTLAFLTQAGVGTMQPDGVGASILSELAQAGVGTEIFPGAGANLLAELAQAGIGTIYPEGVGAQVLSEVAQAGIGVQVFAGAGAQTLANMLQAGLGIEVFAGTAAQTLAALQQVGIGVMFPDGIGNQTLALVAQAGSGAQVFVGTSAQIFAQITQAGVGAMYPDGAGAQTLAELAQAGVGIQIFAG
ncbi:MAG: hypothetical protein V3V01_10535, partial [Acidimicrobiales bacterium]